jgi:CRISPR-associated protein Cmr4
MTAALVRSRVTGALLGLHAQTALHPGSGTALGTVDLPVQRERHTLWPTIPGSALKGILRDACRERRKDHYQDDGPEVEEPNRRTRRDKANEVDPDLVSAFGPATRDADKHAGALSLTDARLLAFPVRSLKGVFAWVSCPAVLERLERDAALAGAPLTWTLPATVPANQAIVATACPCLVEGRHIILEEFDHTTIPDHVSDDLGQWIADHLLPDRAEYRATRERFRRQFMILADDDFTHFARHATEVTARVGLDYETKTVRSGALFYQEFLPPETLFYSVVLANAARIRDGGRSGAAVLQFLDENVPPVLQVGGDETTGKGYCGVRLWTTNGTR